MTPVPATAPSHALLNNGNFALPSILENGVKQVHQQDGAEEGPDDCAGEGAAGVLAAAGGGL